MSPPILDSTISRSARPRRGARGPGPALFVVIQAQNPSWGGGARILLRGLDRVVIGRGPARGTRLLSDDVLRIDLPDGRVSVEHAELQRVLGSWTIGDAGSKNGLFVNGQRLERHTLADGDWVEVGNTFLRFRDRVDAGGNAEAADDPTPGARTLVRAFLCAEF